MALTAEEKVVISWQQDANKFIRDVMPGIVLTTQQKEGFDHLSNLIRVRSKRAAGKALAPEEERYADVLGISIMSGKGTGKDVFAALAIIYFLSAFPNPKIGATAPTGHQLKDVLWSETGHQLKDVLWSEISKWLHRGGENEGPAAVKDWFELQSEKIYLKEKKGERWFAVARTTNLKGTAEEQANTLSGLHEDYMMLVVDEAQGVPPAVYKEIEGSMTGKCNFALLIFNPSRASCYAVDTQYRDRSRWITLRWNAEESERVNQRQVEAQARRYGKDSNYYRWSVLGLPPRSDSNLLFPNDWVMDAIDREVEPLDEDVEIMSLDPGAGGDDTALVRRRGPVVYPVETTNTPESEQLTGWIMRRIFMYEPEVVFIDTIGVGWGIEGNLRSRTSARVIGLNVAHESNEPDRFYRLGDELWWTLRDEFEAGSISIPDDPVLIGELTTIKFEEPNGVIKVESKKDMIKRGVESPNRADALRMTGYYTSQDVRRMKKGKRDDWRKRLGSGSWRTA
jgi:hypothetical protein